jgi:amidase
MVVPAGFTKEVYDRVPDEKDPNGSRLEGPKQVELPVALEFLCRPFEEAKLFEIASVYEKSDDIAARSRDLPCFPTEARDS